MNRSLRRRHLGMVSVLAVAALILLAVAEQVHRSPVTMPVLPVPPRAEPGAGSVLAQGRAAGLALRLLADSAGGGATVELEPLDPIRIADPLAYYAPAAAGDTLPSAAVLLGSLGQGQVLRARLPADSGEILVYSLATRQVVTTARLPRRGAAR